MGGVSVMNILDRDFRNEVWHTIRSNKRRSIATAFGVFWGIFMLVILLSLGHGIENAIIGQLGGISTRSVAMQSAETSVPYEGFRKGRTWSMVTSDVNLIKSKVPEVEHITALISSKNWREKVTYEQKKGDYAVIGIDQNWSQIVPMEVMLGRIINETDVEQRRKYCVAGVEVCKKLLGSETNAVGKTIKVANTYYTIVGVCKSISGMNIGANPSYAIYVPQSLLKQYNNQGETIGGIMYTVKKGYNIKEVRAKVCGVVKQRHHIAPTDKSAIMEMDISEAFKIFDNIMMGISALIWLVGIGTLLSGIVGVMNIMLVTVRERTREIGVRRALGAKPADIITQIMFESTTLTAMAGIIGLVLGIGIMAVVDAVTAHISDLAMMIVSPVIPFSVAIVSLLIILISGFLGGLLPAIRAIQIKAIDAIKDE